MDLVVTGARGFVGKATVRAALAAGYRVRAIVRPGEMLAVEHPLLSLHATGLDGGRALVDVLRGADAVLHLAAAMRGGYSEQREMTVLATTRLIEAQREAGVERMVGLSSFAVYDYALLGETAILDESAPIENCPQRRSVYAQAKCEQDQVFRDAGAVVLRPGIIYDQDRLWQFALGRPLGRRCWLLLGPKDADLPLVHVDDVAQALLLAAKAPPSDGYLAINLVEDRPPQRRALVEFLNSSPRRSRFIVSLPWTIHRALARLARKLAGRSRLPGLLDPVELDVRFKAFRYDNQRARAVLGWRPEQRALGNARVGGQ